MLSGLVAEMIKDISRRIARMAGCGILNGGDPGKGPLEQLAASDSLGIPFTRHQELSQAPSSRAEEMMHVPRVVDRNFHNMEAPYYDQEITAVFGLYHDLGLDPWVDSISKRHKTALDIGAGTGVVALKLAKKFDRVVAIDHSIGMLSVAAEKARARGQQDRIRFLTADCCHIPFPDAAFDVVTIQGLLHHTGSVDLGQTISEAVRVLSPGGVIYISEPSSTGNPIRSSCERIYHICAGILGPVVRLVWRLRLRNQARPNTVEISAKDRCIDKCEEGPIGHEDLLNMLDNAGLRTQIRFVPHFQILGRFPRWIRYWATMVAAMPFSRTRGDIFFIYGEKTADNPVDRKTR